MRNTSRITKLASATLAAVAMLAVGAGAASATYPTWATPGTSVAQTGAITGAPLTFQMGTSAPLVCDQSQSWTATLSNAINPADGSFAAKLHISSPATVTCNTGAAALSADLWARRTPAGVITFVGTLPGAYAQNATEWFLRSAIPVTASVTAAYFQTTLTFTGAPLGNTTAGHPTTLSGKLIVPSTLN